MLLGGSFLVLTDVNWAGIDRPLIDVLIMNSEAVSSDVLYLGEVYVSTSRCMANTCGVHDSAASFKETHFTQM